MNDTTKRRIKRILVCEAIVIILTILACVVLVVLAVGKKEYITYDKVVTYLENGQIKEIQAYQDSNIVTVIMKDEGEKSAVISSLDELTSLVSEKIKNGSDIKFEIEDNTTIELTMAILILMIIGVVVWAISYAIIKVLSGIKAGIKNVINKEDDEIKPVKSKTTFNDIAGIDEEKEQVKEVVEFLIHPKMYEKMGARIPKGILLNGDPGTGKTLLAKAIAGEAKVPFIQKNGSSFEERLVGVGASRIRKLFEKAKEIAPCIIFIDELDSIAQKRYNSKSDNEQTLNQLLAEMDGFDSKDNIIVIAATNHIEVLDQAILRPGRFDRQIFVPRPDVKARKSILKIHARNKKFANDVSLKGIAKKTVGFTGADLENILNEAAIYAVNQKRDCISISDIDEAIARVTIGLEKRNAAFTEEDRYLTAVHESGHALVSAILKPETAILGISIIPRGRTGGYTLQDISDKQYQRKSDLETQIQVCYGGRVAEEIIFKDISTGAASDFEKASNIAHNMVTRFAMDGNFLVKIRDESNYNDEIESERIEQAEEICKNLYQKTQEIISSNKEVLLKLANLLCEKEYLSQEEVDTFFRENLNLR